MKFLNFKIFIIKLFYIAFLFFLLLNIKKKKRIGIISLRHEINIGNNLLKYAIFVKLKELGYTPYIIATYFKNYNISFINRTTNLIIIKKNFTEIKENDYDVLMVNSDQTWRKYDEHFYDYAFLKFAKNWKKTKFIYGASFDQWKLTSEDEKIAKNLLKDFKGISVREQGYVDIIKKHLGILPDVVLDPTLIIDKIYYINIIKNYNKNISSKNKYIFVYTVFNEINLINFSNYANKKLNLDIYNFFLNTESNVENFLYRIYNSKAVITNSYHGTIFSIIFNKPFIAFNDKSIAKERLLSLGKLLGFEKRIINKNENPNYKLLITPLNINQTLLNLLKLKSINYIKDNLNYIK